VNKTLSLDKRQDLIVDTNSILKCKYNQKIVLNTQYDK